MKHTAMRRTAAVLLTLVCGFSLFTIPTAPSVDFSVPAYAFGEEDKVADDQRVQEAKQKKEQLQKQLETVQAEIKKAQNTQTQQAQAKRAMEQQKQIIAEQIGVLITTIGEAEAAVNEKEEEIRLKTKAIEQKKEEIDEQWDDFKLQVAAMQKLNDTGFVAMLSNVKSLYQLLTFSNTMQEISRRDTEILDNMKAQKEELKKQREELDAEKEELEAAKEELENQKSELDNKSSELSNSIQAADAAITKAEADEAAKKEISEATRKELEAAEAAYESAVRAALSAAQQNSGGSGGDFTSSLFTWPLPGYHKITTYFGESDAYGRAGHKGIDISGQYSMPPIYAAAGGKVTVSGVSSSYGNYVVIYHGQDTSGNGYATLYAHLSSRSVSEGQEVSNGQLIGYVGNTGWSQGLHLHFEVRVNGSPVNPFNYFS